MGDANDTPPVRAGIARGYAFVEDVAYIGLGALLAALVLVLIVGTAISFGRHAVAWTVAAHVSELLDQVLLVLLLVELLYTVQVSFREHTLMPEPFLLVGLISAIRRVLVLTATLSEQREICRGPPQSLTLELAVLAAMILSLAVALVLVRRRAPDRGAQRT